MTQAGPGIAQQPMQSSSRVFPAHPRQVREARAFLARVLADCPAEHDAVLCLSELASNAVLHSANSKTGGTFTVRAEICPGRAWIAVQDNGGPWVQHDHHDGRQHGLAIVAELAAAGWGRDGDPLTGWVVWAVLEWACPGPGEQANRKDSTMTSTTDLPATTATTRPAQRWTTVLDGHQLRQLRGQHGLSRAGLAAQAGISQATLARLERQPYASCRSRTLARLAAALGEDPARLTSARP
ncbi:MAG: helix-turn-helix domain-containing protein [Streptosporangiaceae bacterium]